MKNLLFATCLLGLAALTQPVSAAPAKADAAAPPLARAGPALQLLEQIPAPNVVGRLDHLTLDHNHIRFFVSALGNDTIEAFDFSSAKWIFSISGLNTPKGILYVPEVQKLFS